MLPVTTIALTYFFLVEIKLLVLVPKFPCPVAQKCFLQRFFSAFPNCNKNFPKLPKNYQQFLCHKTVKRHQRLCFHCPRNFGAKRCNHIQSLILLNFPFGVHRSATHSKSPKKISDRQCLSMRERREKVDQSFFGSCVLPRGGLVFPTSSGDIITTIGLLLLFLRE